MSALNAIISEAKKRDAQRVLIREGATPSFLTARGLVDARTLQPVKAETLDRLFSSLFPKAGDMASHQRHVREIKVTGVGTLKCIGLTDLRQINLYLMPAGQEVYKYDYFQFFPDARDTDEESAVNEGTEDEGDVSPSQMISQTMHGVLLGKSDEQQDGQQQQREPDSGRLIIPALGGRREEEAGVAQGGVAEQSGGEEPAQVASPEPSVVAPAPKLEAVPPPVGEQSPVAAPPSAPPIPAAEAQGAQEAQEAQAVQAVVGAGKEEGGQEEEHLSMMDELGTHTQVHQIKTPQPGTGITSQGQSQQVVSEGGNTIDVLFRKMVERKASDLHITSQQPLAFRIDGEVEIDDGVTKVTAEDLERWFDPIVPQENRNGWDMDFTYEIKDVGRFRINLFRDYWGMGAVVRHVPNEIKTCDDLNIPEIIKKLCYLSKGLVLITGAAGSGRSTTLAAIIDLINATRKCHLLTIEDPVEFVHRPKKSLVRQREVGKHTDSFHAALQASLREDPDVICIGDLRDMNTAAMAMRSVEAGRLIFGVMHTRSTVAAIEYLINLFPIDHQKQACHALAGALRGVICQALIRKKEGGRVAAHEVLIVTDMIANVIREGKIDLIMHHMTTQKTVGNISLNDSLLRLVLDKEIDRKDAVSAAVDKKALHMLAHRKGIKLSA